MTDLETQYFTFDVAGVSAAARILRAGGLVALPTETVYGLGVDARNSDAVARLFAAKGRPSFNPLIVHVASLAQAEALVGFDDTARILAQAFWPGALTLVLPLNDGSGISPLVTAGLTTLAVRVPDHPVAQAVLTEAGIPIAAPSANPSGQVSPTRADHVISQMDGKIDAALLGGECSVGVESTIIATRPGPGLLRAGGIPVEAIEACLGTTLARAGDGAVPTSPGQLASHYAPKGSVRLNATQVQEGEILLGFGKVDAEINLSPNGDLGEAAANLFDALHRLNAMDAMRIAVSPVPELGLGRAINDRLRRAAAPR